MSDVSKEQDCLLEEADRDQHLLSDARPSSVRGSGFVGLITFIILCAISISLNIFFAVEFFSPRQVEVVEHTSRYAELQFDSTMAWQEESEFFRGRENHSHTAWNQFNGDAGTVALSDEYVALAELPIAQRFPWDETKGLYIINAFHALHCIKKLHQSLVAYSNGLEPKVSLGHNFHCLDSLRADTICFADDTPRYTGMDQPPGSSGLAQSRQCRDWSKLVVWGRQHDACFSDVMSDDYDFDTLRRHRYCQPGSPYQARVDEIFGDEPLPP